MSLPHSLSLSLKRQLNRSIFSLCSGLFPYSIGSWWVRSGASVLVHRASQKLPAMESSEPSPEDAVAARALEKGRRNTAPPSAGAGSHVEVARVSGPSDVVPEEALGGAAQNGERPGPELQSRSHSFAEVVDEVELSLPGGESEMVEAEGGPTNGKIEDEGAPKKGDEGGEGELLLGVGLAENRFLVGDFVWGKIKHHPWWPGQVYDSSDASEYAKKLRRRDEQCVLVAYFGDRTFAWCEPSQLRPFSEGFEEMAHQSISKNFIGALKEALDEIQRSLESEILGSRLSAGHVVNAGIREGVTGPEGRVKGLTIVDKMPAEVLERLREVACDVSSTDLLEVTAINAWFSALARWMGWRVEHPAELEDEKVHVNGGSPLGISAMESSEKVEPEGPAAGGGGAAKRRVKGEKSYHRKKVRSMAELIAETDMDVVRVEDGIGREEKPVTVKKLDSLGRQQRKKNQARSSDSENVDVEREEGPGSGRRERKRSRYLSPPYTTMSVRANHSVFLKDGETGHPKKDLEASETGESETRMENPHPIFSTCSTEVSPDDKMASAFEVGGGASAEDMLYELWRAALDSTYLKGDLSSSRFRIFFDRFRGYSYASVSDYGESGVEELRSEADDGRCSFYQEGESEPNVNFETSDRSPAPSGCKSTPERRKEPLSCDTDDSGVSKSEEKSMSVAQGTSGYEKVNIQPKRNGEDEINGDDEAAIQLTLGSGPTISPPGQKPPLQFIKKSLESMISALRSSFPLSGKAAADSSDGLEPAARDNLVCEMNGLLQKVDELMAGSAASGPA